MLVTNSAEGLGRCREFSLHKPDTFKLNIRHPCSWKSFWLLHCGDISLQLYILFSTVIRIPKPVEMFDKNLSQTEATPGSKNSTD